MTRALVLLAILSSSCIDSCTAVGGGALRQTALHGGAAMQGPSMSPPVDGDDAPAVVGIDWPFTSTLLWEAGKETTVADNDVITTPSQFGSQTTVLPTQVTIGAQPQYQDPCDVGPAIPCWYLDGGDKWEEALADSALKYLHDGTGMTCYVVAEPVNTTPASSTFIATGQRDNNQTGFALRFSSSASDRLQGQVSNGVTSISVLPGGGTGLQDQTWAAVYSHGTARTPDAIGGWRGATPTNVDGDYTSTVSTGNPYGPVAVGGASGFLIHRLTGYIFAIACENALHDATMIANTWAAIEAETGALPQ